MQQMCFICLLVLTSLEIRRSFAANRKKKKSCHLYYMQTKYLAFLTVHRKKKTSQTGLQVCQIQITLRTGFFSLQYLYILPRDQLINGSRFSTAPRQPCPWAGCTATGCRTSAGGQRSQALKVSESYGQGTPLAEETASPLPLCHCETKKRTGVWSPFYFLSSPF